MRSLACRVSGDVIYRGSTTVRSNPEVFIRVTLSYIGSAVADVFL